MGIKTYIGRQIEKIKSINTSGYFIPEDKTREAIPIKKIIATHTLDLTGDGKSDVIKSPAPSNRKGMTFCLETIGGLDATYVGVDRERHKASKYQGGHLIRSTEERSSNDLYYGTMFNSRQGPVKIFKKDGKLSLDDFEKDAEVGFSPENGYTLIGEIIDKKTYRASES